MCVCVCVCVCVHYKNEVCFNLLEEKKQEIQNKANKNKNKIEKTTNNTDIYILQMSSLFFKLLNFTTLVCIVYTSDIWK